MAATLAAHLDLVFPRRQNFLSNCLHRLNRILWRSEATESFVNQYPTSIFNLGEANV